MRRKLTDLHSKYGPEAVEAFFRGVLCGACNVAIGYWREQPERIRALLQYVETRCKGDSR